MAKQSCIYVAHDAVILSIPFVPEHSFYSLQNATIIVLNQSIRSDYAGKIMKYLYTLFILVFITGTAMAQNRFGNTNGVVLADFENTTYIQFDENAHKLFWAVNLNAFNGNQKSSFQEWIFKSELLVACSTPDANNIWYLSSSKAADEASVIIELNKMVDKARNLTIITQDKYQ